MRNNLPTIRLADPGVNLLLGQQTQQSLTDMPLTLMAKNATLKKSGHDVEGYRDYRGVPVIGVWLWNKTLNIGITSEQDVDEAYNLLNFVKLLMIIATVFFSGLLLFLFVFLSVNMRRIQKAERKLRSVIDTANDAIITISARGIITSINPATEKMFGYKKNELLGYKINKLMPEPYHSEHDGYIKSYLSTGKSTVIGAGRDAMGLHANGNVFDIHLSVARFELGGTVFFSGTIKDISREKALFKEIKMERHKAEVERDKYSHVNKLLLLTQQALNRTEIGEIWLNPDTGQIIKASQHFCDLLGYSEKRLQNMKIWDAVPHYSKEQYQTTIEMLKEKGWFRFESIAQSSSGQRVPMEITAMYHEASNPRKSFVIAFCINITERKENEAALILSRRAAEEANQAKSTFLATMSHEIRTPLNGIVGTIDLLSLTPLSTNQLGLAQTAIESAKLLQRVIDDILDFSKIEAGKLELENIPFNVETQLNQVADSLCIQATQHDVELLIYCDPTIPWVMGDPVRVKQVLFNLVGNAIKFSKGSAANIGKVFVGIYLSNSSQAKTTVTIKVADNGIGMDETEKSKLFKPFSQAEQNITRRFGGTGLGLTITKRLLDIMQGSISVESQKGHGSEFTVTLNFSNAKQQQSHSLPSLQGIDVFILNAIEPRIKGILHDYLEHAKAKVRELETKEFVAYLSGNTESTTSKQVIILDTKSHPESLTTLKRNLLDKKNLAQQPYVLVARGRRRSPRVLQDKNVTIDLNSMHRETLINAIAVTTGVISQNRIEEADIYSGNEQLKPLLESREQAVEEKKLVLLVDDNEINRKVIGRQLEMLGFWADMAEEGQQALSLWKANSYAVILTDCHMPIMDGYELTRQIRAKEVTPEHVPILAITADALKGTEKLCHEAGMDDYITKPMQLAELNQVLDRLLRNTPSTIAPESIDINQKERNETSPIDTSILAEYYQEFLTTSQLIIDEITKSLAQKSASELGKLAHKLKSSARMVGAISLADVCLILEKAGKCDDFETIEIQFPQLQTLFKQVKDWVVKRTNNDN